MSTVPAETTPGTDQATMTVTLRFFAAARAAAGTEAETLTVAPDTTLADLGRRLRARGPELDRVLRRCSYLCDGVAVRDDSLVLRGGQTIDVLPPFAGG